MDNGRIQLAMCETENVAQAMFKNQDEARYGIKTIS
jgi:hypothetical protein